MRDIEIDAAIALYYYYYYGCTRWIIFLSGMNIIDIAGSEV